VGSTITVAGGGSSAGLANVAAGTSDIGDSDVPVTAAPTINAASVTDHQVAIVVFAVVVNSGAGVSNLTSAQVQGVFSGTITNWSQAGGNSVPVTLIERKPGSGTRISFDKDVMNGTPESTTPAATQDSTSLVVQSVANPNTPGAISYINVASVASGMNAVALNGVLPATVNVAAGKYGFYSHEHMYTKGAGSTLAQSFIQYIAGPFQRKLPTGFATLATTSALSLSDK
jgi:phosphate transport system substrate-binding protein